MLTADEIDALGEQAVQLITPVTDFLIADIARRISEAGQLTGTAAYQTWRLQQLGVSQRQLKRELRKRLKVSHRELRELLTQAAEAGYNFDISRFPYIQAVPFEKNGAIQRIVSAAVKLAQDDLTNITQTMGFVTANGKAVGLSEAYRQSCDFAFTKVSTGAQDYNSAIREAVKSLAEKGVRTIDYDSGAHTSVEAAVRRNIMGGLGLMQEKISRQNHDDLGCDGWEISAHAASAPDHEPIQGKQYSDAAYKKLNESLVRRIGTLNCGHAAFPIILGVNSPQYTPEELEQMRQDNEKGVDYEGRHFTMYEATKRQRQIERNIRKQKRRILAAEQNPEDKERLQQARIKYQVLDQEYKRFSNAAGLRLQHERMEMTCFGPKQANAAEKAAKNAGTQKETLANRINNAIMNNTEMYSKTDDVRKGFKFISDERFDALTVEARKKGAVIIRGVPEVERHLETRGASAATVGDVLMFKKDVCVSEVIEEMHHLNQNQTGLNDDKGEPLRTILNEIDAKEYVIRVAQKYQVPRNELEHIQKQLDGYRQQLKNFKKGG